MILRDELGVEKVWDIKSASEWAYKYKFTGAGGYEAIKRDDPFGYAMQGFLYAEAVGLPFGGWIVVNKSSGEIAVVDVPDWCQEDKKEYLKDAAERVKFLTDPMSNLRVDFSRTNSRRFARKGEDVRTGNKLLAKQCSMCGFKHHCWPNAVYHDKVTSRPRTRPKGMVQSSQEEGSVMPYIFVRDYDIDLMELNKDMHHVFVESVSKSVGSVRSCTCVSTNAACP